MRRPLASTDISLTFFTLIKPHPKTCYTSITLVKTTRRATCRRELVLAAFAPALGEAHAPSQIHKLLFVLVTECSSALGDCDFDFMCGPYGPFGREIYGILAALAEDGLVVISREKLYPIYRLTVRGQAAGEKALGSLTPNMQTYFHRLSEWIRPLSFSQLAASIYKAYPEMAVNAVFQRNTE